MNYSPAISNPNTTAPNCITPKNQTKSQEPNTSEACATLYRRYAKKIYRKCLFMLRDKALAEDATHDIFIKIYLNLAAYEARANISTWMYTIAYNHCLDILRKQRKLPVVDLQMHDEIQVSDTTETHQNKELQISNMQTALTKLSKQERTILQMKYREGKTVQEIAMKMRTTESAMKMRLKRAKERARCQMEVLPS